MLRGKVYFNFVKHMLPQLIKVRSHVLNQLGRMCAKMNVKKH